MMAGGSGASCKAYCTGNEDEVLIVRRSDDGSHQSTTAKLTMDTNGGGGYSNGIHSIGGGMYGSAGSYAGTGSSQVTTIL